MKFENFLNLVMVGMISYHIGQHNQEKRDIQEVNKFKKELLHSIREEDTEQSNTRSFGDYLSEFFKSREEDAK